VVQRGHIYTWQTTVTPKLNITAAGTNAVVSWIVPSTSFHLQGKNTLATTNWTDVAAPVSLNLTSVQNQVMLPSTNGTAFFRLTSP